MRNTGECDVGTATRSFTLIAGARAQCSYYYEWAGVQYERVCAYDVSGGWTSNGVTDTVNFQFAFANQLCVPSPSRACCAVAGCQSCSNFFTCDDVPLPLPAATTPSPADATTFIDAGATTFVSAETTLGDAEQTPNFYDAEGLNDARGRCSGVCQDDSKPCSQAYQTGRCPGARNIRCCPSGGGSNNNGGGGGGNDDGGSVPDAPSVSANGGLFPVKSGSLDKISVNWGGRRDNGRRCHAGIDLYTRSGGAIQAISDGVVSGIRQGWYRCGGRSIDAIFIFHSNGPAAGKTINYAEVTPGTYSVRVGQQVRAGQSLGSATYCRMLHLEQYSGRQSGSQQWKPTGPWRGGTFSGCAVNYLGSKPPALQDPRPLVKALRPAGAAFHAGTNFLNDDGDEAFAADEALVEDNSPEDDTETGGIIAGVVMGAVLLACLVAVVIFVVLQRRAKKRRELSVSVQNGAFMSAAGATLNGAPMTSARYI